MLLGGHQSSPHAPYSLSGGPAPHNSLTGSQLRAADQRNGTTSAFRFDFGAADAGAAAAPASAPADADAASATSRPITRIAAVQATAAETRVVDAGGERFDLAVAESSQVVQKGVYEGGRELWKGGGCAWRDFEAPGLKGHYSSGPF